MFNKALNAFGGSVYINQVFGLHVNNSNFYSNKAYIYGGAMFI